LHSFPFKSCLTTLPFRLEDEEAGDGTANIPPINNDTTRKCKEDTLRDEWVIAISKAMVLTSLQTTLSHGFDAWCAG
jgi:hypothetical protein